MDEDSNLFHGDELSAEDQAVLDAFDSMDFPALEETPSEADNSASSAETSNTSTVPDSKDARVKPSSSSLPGVGNTGNTGNTGNASEVGETDDEEQFSDEDMLLIFVSEVEGDLSNLRQELQRLEPGESETLNAASLHAIKYSAHKIKGTGGTFGSTIFYDLGKATETLAGMIADNKFSSFIGLDILARAITALEDTLAGLVETGEVPSGPLAELEVEFGALNIDIVDGTFNRYSELDHALDELLRQQEAMNAVRLPLLGEDEEMRAITKPLQELTAGTPSVRVDTARFEQLLLHAEQLVDLSSPLAGAQQQVEDAMRELQAAQSRLTRLEALYSTLPLTASTVNGTNGQGHSEDRPASSLIANILDQAETRIGHPYQRKNAKRSRHPAARPPLYWDEMEIDRYTETDVLRSALSEAIADVATATAQLRVSFARLDAILRQHTTRAQYVRDDTLSLRMTTVSELVARIERAVKMNVKAQQGHLLFEAQGETTEIDQHILEELKNPLLLLVRTCLTNSAHRDALNASDTAIAAIAQHTEKAWFHAQGIGSEIALELGFSMDVGSAGGAGSVGSSIPEEVQESLHRLHGSIMARRNNAGGLSFHLRLPRSQGPVQALLVRVGQHHMIVPIAQVRRIEYDAPPRRSASTTYTLGNLLGFPAEANDEKRPLPMLMLQHDAAHVHIEVDEIAGVIEQVVKPLPPHLRRPGIAGSAIDGAGNILLMVNLPELIRHATQRQYTLPVAQNDAARTSKTHQRIVLVADDSVYIRQSLLKSLREAGYQAKGVPDGKVALERLQDQPPDVLLLDIEMPNLNGFDLLTIIGANPQLATVKIIMLTSRGGEKHHKRALELGAHAYLTKPCPQDVLLKTIASLLM